MTHQQTNDAVRQSLIGRPRDTYPERRAPIQSRESQVAAVRVTDALANLEVARTEEARQEFVDARLELRRCIHEDARRSREARA